MFAIEVGQEPVLYPLDFPRLSHFILKLVFMSSFPDILYLLSPSPLIVFR